MGSSLQGSRRHPLPAEANTLASVDAESRSSGAKAGSVGWYGLVGMGWLLWVGSYGLVRMDWLGYVCWCVAVGIHRGRGFVDIGSDSAEYTPAVQPAKVVNLVDVLKSLPDDTTQPLRGRRRRSAEPQPCILLAETK